MQQAVVKFVQLFLFAFDDVISVAGVAVIYHISLGAPFALRETTHTYIFFSQTRFSAQLALMTILWTDCSLD